MEALRHYLVTQAYNNAWSNHRLLTACGALSQADFEATRTSFFPSIRETLNHNLAVDRYYIDAMERCLAGQPLNPTPTAFFDPDQEVATCAALHADQAVTDRRLIAVCRALEPATLAQDVAVPRSDKVSVMPWPRLLAHLFQHQVHHRGQAHAMLAGTPVAPPQLDEFFSVDEAPLRAADFAALGFTEDEIWRSKPGPASRPPP